MLCSLRRCFVAKEPVTDQNKRREPDQFPKDREHHEIVGENDSDIANMKSDSAAK